MRTKLDDIGLKVAEHQEDSMQNRRKLAESTREFKKNNEAVSKTVGPLLKQYQARSLTLAHQTAGTATRRAKLPSRATSGSRMPQRWGLRQPAHACPLFACSGGD
jgi:hypothetical protein